MLSEQERTLETNLQMISKKLEILQTCLKKKEKELAKVLESKDKVRTS